LISAAVRGAEPKWRSAASKTLATNGEPMALARDACRDSSPPLPGYSVMVLPSPVRRSERCEVITKIDVSFAERAQRSEMLPIVSGVGLHDLRHYRGRQRLDRGALASLGRRDTRWCVAHVEPARLLRQSFDFASEVARSRGGLLHHGGILLRRLIHAADCSADFGDRHRLSLVVLSDMSEQPVHFGHVI